MHLTGGKLSDLLALNSDLKKNTLTSNDDDHMTYHLGNHTHSHKSNVMSDEVRTLEKYNHFSRRAATQAARGCDPDCILANTRLKI